MTKTWNRGVVRNTERSWRVNETREPAKIAAYDPFHITAYDVPVPSGVAGKAKLVRLWRISELNEHIPMEQRICKYEQEARDALMLSTRVPYPGSHINGALNVIRARQSMLIASGTIRDILHSFKQSHKESKGGVNYEKLPKHVQMTISDPLEAIAAVELLRALVDEENVPYEKALAIVQKCFTFKPNEHTSGSAHMLPHKLAGEYIGRHIQLMALVQNGLIEDALRERGVQVELQQGFHSELH